MGLISRRKRLTIYVYLESDMYCRPITGPIIPKLGWRFCFKFFSIACGILFLLQFFCSMPSVSTLASIDSIFWQCRKQHTIVKRPSLLSLYSSIGIPKKRVQTYRYCVTPQARRHLGSLVRRSMLRNSKFSVGYTQPRSRSGLSSSARLPHV